MWIEGQGTPVVLIHGYTGNLDRHWINPGVLAKLAADHRVIALDCRGTGRVTSRSMPARYGAEMGQDIVRLARSLQDPACAIVGFSMGAIIAGQLLTTNPDRFSPPPSSPTPPCTPGPARTTASLKRPPAILKATRRSDR